MIRRCGWCKNLLIPSAVPPFEDKRETTGICLACKLAIVGQITGSATQEAKIAVERIGAVHE